MTHDAFIPGLLGRIPSPRKTVVVCASRIGDYICATPAFRALRAALPDSEISIIAMPFIAPLVERNPRLNRHITFPGFPGMAEQFFEARRALEFFAAMQGEAFDLAIQMHGSGVNSNPFTLMLGARFVAGFVRPGDPPGRLDAALAWPEDERASHRGLRLMEFLGAPLQGEEPELPLSAADHHAAAIAMAGRPRPWIGLHAGSREAGKRWPVSHFGALARRLREGTLFLLGGPEEAAAALELSGSIGVRAANLAGRLSIPEMAAAIARLDLLVTNDSAPAHMAYALGTSSVTLFAETDPAIWGPPPREQHKIAVAKDLSIASLSVELVLEAASAALRA